MGLQIMYGEGTIHGELLDNTASLGEAILYYNSNFLRQCW